MSWCCINEGPVFSLDLTAEGRNSIESVGRPLQSAQFLDNLHLQGERIEVRNKTAKPLALRCIKREHHEVILRVKKQRL